MIAQQEQENMLSTILEVSCEDATPMTSLVDVHQHRLQSSPPPKIPLSNVNDNEEDDDDDDDEEEEEEEINRPKAPSFSSIDEMPVSTIFSKNESKILFKYFSFYIVFIYPRFKIQ
jgi:hypothetical protein